VVLLVAHLFCLVVDVAGVQRLRWLRRFSRPCSVSSHPWVAPSRLFGVTPTGIGVLEQSMQTVYTVTEVDGGSEVTATTEFALNVALVGEILNATVIKRQRRHELESQFDWLTDQVES